MSRPRRASRPAAPRSTITGDHFHPGITATIAQAPFAIQDGFDVHTHFAVTPPLTPGSLNDVTVTNTDGQFATLPAAFFADFLDAPSGNLFHAEIETIFRAGITAGCGAGNYCTDAPASRAQMAVLLLKVEHGPAYVPPPCAGVFPDVPAPLSSPTGSSSSPRKRSRPDAAAATTARRRRSGATSSQCSS